MARVRKTGIGARAGFCVTHMCMTWDAFLAAYPGRVLSDEPLAKHTTMRLGGKARFAFAAQSVAEVADALRAAEASGLRAVVLGGGSNVLFSDAGFDGLVIFIAFREVVFEGARVRADAGAISAGFARACAERGLSGLAWLATLPGTIGGAVRGNAGCFGGEMKDLLTDVSVLRDGEILTLPREACDFGYRESIFKHNRDVILSATFALSQTEPEACLRDISAILAKRKATQPMGIASAGCMFKNFSFQNPQDLGTLMKAADVPPEFLAKHMIPAGWLIEQTGLKGFCIGGACVSDVHANFLTVKPGATSDHIFQLIAVVKTRVRDTLGIQLQEEVQLYT